MKTPQKVSQVWPSATTFSRMGQRSSAPDYAYTVSAIDFLRDLAKLFGGDGHGLGISTIGLGNVVDLIEILGDLPPALRIGLKKVAGYGRPWGRASSASIVWFPCRDGVGEPFEIPTFCVALDLIAERRLLMEKGR